MHEAMSQSFAASTRRMGTESWATLDCLWHRKVYRTSKLPVAQRRSSAGPWWLRCHSYHPCKHGLALCGNCRPTVLQRPAVRTASPAGGTCCWQTVTHRRNRGRQTHMPVLPMKQLGCGPKCSKSLRTQQPCAAAWPPPCSEPRRRSNHRLDVGALVQLSFPLVHDITRQVAEQQAIMSPSGSQHRLCRATTTPASSWSCRSVSYDARLLQRCVKPGRRCTRHARRRLQQLRMQLGPDQRRTQHARCDRPPKYGVLQCCTTTKA